MTLANSLPFLKNFLLLYSLLFFWDSDFTEVRSCNSVTQISGVLPCCFSFYCAYRYCAFCKLKVYGNPCMENVYFANSFFSLCVHCVTFQLYSHSFRLFIVIICFIIICYSVLCSQIFDVTIATRLHLTESLDCDQHFLPIKYFF